jgi:hypothetical protein
MTNYTVIHHADEASRKPALGHRWAQIPTIRLLITIPPEEVERRSRTVAPVLEGPEEDILSYQGPDGRFWPAFKRTIRRLPVLRPKVRGSLDYKLHNDANRIREI